MSSKKPPAENNRRGARNDRRLANYAVAERVQENVRVQKWHVGFEPMLSGGVCASISDAATGQILGARLASSEDAFGVAAFLLETAQSHGLPASVLVPFTSYYSHVLRHWCEYHRVPLDENIDVASLVANDRARNFEEEARRGGAVAVLNPIPRIDALEFAEAMLEPAPRMSKFRWRIKIANLSGIEHPSVIVFDTESLCVVGTEVSSSFTSASVLRVLDAALRRYGVPRAIHFQTTPGISFPVLAWLANRSMKFKVAPSPSRSIRKRPRK